MIGTLVVTHGQLAAEMVQTMEMIVGPRPGIRAVCLSPEDGVEEARDRIGEALAGCDGKALILTDMFGGTPANLALTYLDPGQVEIVTGFNLPMLLKLATTLDQEEDVGKLARSITAYGKRNIAVAGDLLEGR